MIKKNQMTKKKMNEDLGILIVLLLKLFTSFDSLFEYIHYIPFMCVNEPFDERIFLSFFRPFMQRREENLWWEVDQIKLWPIFITGLRSVILNNSPIPFIIFILWSLQSTKERFLCLCIYIRSSLFRGSTAVMRSI